MIKVTKVPVETDLSAFSHWLTGQGVIHRIVEEDGEQVVYLPTEDFATEVTQAVQAYISDPKFRYHVEHTKPVWRVSTAPTIDVPYQRAHPRQAPFIFLLILSSLLVAWLTNFGQAGPLTRSFLIVDPLLWEIDSSTVNGRLVGLYLSLLDGQIWRLFSPDILHFSLLHITFNLIMLWVLGGQLEIQRGTASFIIMFVFVSIISNVAQLMDSGVFFGGLSGVVYGLIGYCWVWKQVDARIFLPDPLLKFSIVWLLIGYTPLTESIGLGAMANSAHLYGLLAGLLWGAVTTRIDGKRIALLAGNRSKDRTK